MKQLQDSLPPVPVHLYFDTETTSLAKDCAIIQLSGYYKSKVVFNEYIIPTQKISVGASAVNGLEFIDGEMFYRGTKVPCMPLDQCLRKFLTWVEQCAAAGKGKVTLIGHNSQRFDAPRLVRAVNCCGLLPRLRKVEPCFSDTLPLFRKLYNGKTTDFSQPALVKNFTAGDTYEAHNACEDAKMLAKLVKNAGATSKDLDEFSFSLDSVLQKL